MFNCISFFFQLEDATEKDGNKGSEDENISEGALADLGNLKVSIWTCSKINWLAAYCSDYDLLQPYDTYVLIMVMIFTIDGYIASSNHRIVKFSVPH
jgi:hypothetical protein